MNVTDIDRRHASLSFLPTEQFDTISLTRQELFGRHRQPGSNPDDVIPLCLGRLRECARDSLVHMGLQSA